MPAKISPALSRSAATASATPGYCTFTATARPSWVIARWTWPIDAEAMGAGSHSAKISSGSPPSSWRITPAASSALIGGALCWSSASTLRTFSGRPWSR